MQEGEKSYEYGWLDKVTRILENGKEVARFEYHNNNQLAKVVRENGIETFEWDGLALIERNGTKYINEPHAGGGNPILAIGGDGQKTEAIFTDILGTSMGKVSGNGYSAIDKTSFGADTSDKSSFFTGKPYVEGLGYAFLFRNYRADIGKWLTQDILGYPNGFNNFAYCGNMPAFIYDPDGCLWSWVSASVGAISSVTGYAISCSLSGESISYSGITAAAAGGFVAGGVFGALLGDPSAATVSALVAAGAISSATGKLVENTISTSLDPNKDFSYISIQEGLVDASIQGALTAGLSGYLNLNDFYSELMGLSISTSEDIMNFIKDYLGDKFDELTEAQKQELMNNAQSVME